MYTMYMYMHAGIYGTVELHALGGILKTLARLKEIVSDYTFRSYYRAESIL